MLKFPNFQASTELNISTTDIIVSITITPRKTFYKLHTDQRAFHVLTHFTSQQSSRYFKTSIYKWRNQGLDFEQLAQGYTAKNVDSVLSLPVSP